MPFDHEHPLSIIAESVKYHISDLDTSASPYNYYGFVDQDGNWFIMQEDPINGTYRYANYMSDLEGYQSAWGNRAILTYDYYSGVF